MSLKMTSSLDNRGICFLMLLMISSSFLSIPEINQNSLSNTSNFLNRENIENLEEKKRDIEPLSQDYLTNITGTKDNVNITIHQAYQNLDNTTISDVSSTFTVPAPNATAFSSSFTNISIGGLSIKNHSLTIEDEIDRDVEKDVKDNVPLVTSFSTPSSSYLNNASFYVRRIISAQPGYMNIWLYNSTWDSGNSISVPGPILSYVDLGTIYVDGNGWKTKTNINHFLNNSKTDNNTWFIGLKDNSDIQYDGGWYYTQDDADGDNIDETKSYEYTGTWDLIDEGSGYVDLITKVGVGLNLTTLKPSSINLSINNSQVVDNGFRNGDWFSDIPFTGINNQIEFELTANWYDFNCNITTTQVNYTKLVKKSPTYTLNGTDSVLWSFSHDLLAFDYRLNNNTINFSIPLSWDNWSVSLDSVPKIPLTSLNSSARILTIIDSGSLDGLWSFNAQSPNFFDSIDSVVKGIGTSLAYANDTVIVNVTSPIPLNGDVNLSVYNPSIVNNELIYTNITSIVDTYYIEFWPWILAENISEYGKYRIQVSWENLTDISLIEKNLGIAGPTNYSLITEKNQEFINTDPMFNISLYFQDEFKNENVTGAEIFYKLHDSWDSEIQNNPNFQYNVTINPADYAVGDHVIPITLNATNYMNLTLNFPFSIVNASTVNYIASNSELSDIIFGQNATYYFNYTYEKASVPTGITGASLSKNSPSGSVDWSFKDETAGEYSIHINTSDLDLSTTSYTYNFTISRQNYETQTVEFSITVIPAQTAIENLQNNNSIIKRNTGLNATFEFSVRDTDNNLLIPNIPNENFTVYNITGIKEIWDTEGSFNWSVSEISGSPGYYELNVSLEDPNQGVGNLPRLTSGNYSILLNVSHSPNYNWNTIEIGFYIEGNTTSIVLNRIHDTAGNTEYILPTSGDALVWNDPYYDIYQTADGSDIYVGLQFDVLDTEYANEEQTDTSAQIYISWNGTTEITTSQILGYYSNNPDYYYYYGFRIPDNTASDSYDVTIIWEQANYENATYLFILNIKDRDTDTDLTKVYQPDGPNGNANITYVPGTNTHIGYMNYNLEIYATFNDISGTSTAITDATYAVLNYKNVNYTYSSIVGDEYKWIIYAGNFTTEETEIITIYFGSDDFQNATYSFNFELILIPTDVVQFEIFQHQANAIIDYTASNNTYTAYSAWILEFSARYNDEAKSTLIGDALYAKLEYRNQNNSIDGDTIATVYNWTLAIGDLLPGSYEITIYFGEIGYTNASYSFNLTLVELPTALISFNIKQPLLNSSTLAGGDPYNAYIAYDLEIQITYFDTNNSLPINLASLSNLNYNSQNYPIDSSALGVYTWVINADQLQMGSAQDIVLTLNKTDYVLATHSFQINVLNVATSQTFNSILQPDHVGYETDPLTTTTANNYTAYRAYNVTIEMQLLNLIKGGTGVDDAVANLTFDTITYGGTYLGSGIYQWNITSAMMILTTYDVHVEFWRTGFENHTYDFQINTKDLETSITTAFSQTAHNATTYNDFTNPIITYKPFGVEINATYFDDNNSAWISGAEVQLTYDPLGTIPLDYQSNGNYGWVIAYSDLEVAIDQISLSIGKQYYENHTESLDIDVRLLPTDYTFNFIRQPDHVGYGTDQLLYPSVEIGFTGFSIYDVVVNVSYSDPTNGSSSIQGATAELFVDGLLVSSGVHLNGMYGFVIDHLSDFSVGTYNITINITKAFYNNQTDYSFNLTISDLPTKADMSTLDIIQPDRVINTNIQGSGFAYTGFIFYDLYLNISYTDTNNTEFIDSATLATITYDGHLINIYSYDIGSHLYCWKIPSNWLVEGVKSISIRFNESYYEGNDTVITLTIELFDTDAILEDVRQNDYLNQPDLIENPADWFTGYDSFDLTVNITYENLDYYGGDDIAEEKLDASFAILALNTTNNYTSNYFGGTNQIGFQIPAGDLYENLYEITIYLGSSGYQNRTYNFNLTIEILATTVNFNDTGAYYPDWIGHVDQPLNYLSTSPFHIEGYILYNISLEMQYYDEVVGQGLENADTASLLYQSQTFIGTNLGGGYYQFDLLAVNLTYGSHYMNITFAKNTYQNATLNILLDIIVIPTLLSFEDIIQSDIDETTLEFSNGHYQSYILFDLNLTANFSETVDGNGLSVLNYVNVTYDSEDYLGIHLSNGVYSFMILSENMTLGTYILTLNFMKYGYESQIYNFNLNISNILTTASIENIQQTSLSTSTLEKDGDSYQAYILYDIQIQIKYWNEVQNLPINSVDTIQITSVFGSSTGTFVSDGIYSFLIQSQDLSLVQGQLFINFTKNGYFEGNITLNLNINRLDTDNQLLNINQPEYRSDFLSKDQGSDEYIAYLPYNLIISYDYLDIVNNIDITTVNSATLDFNSHQFSATYNGSAFIWTIPASSFSEGSYSLAISFTKTNYDSQTDTIEVQIIPVPTDFEIITLYQPDQSAGNVTYDAELGEYLVYSDFDFIVNATFEDNVLESPITSGLSATLAYNGTIYNAEIDIATGILSWNLTSENLTAGTHTFELTLQKSGFSNESMSVTIRIIAEAILKFDLIEFPEDILQGTPASIQFRIYYEQDGEIIPLSEELITLNFNITGIDPVSRSTDSEGYVTFLITFPEDDYQNVELRLIYNGITYGIASGEESFRIQTIQPGLPVWITWLVIGLVGSVSLALIVKAQIIDPRKKHFTDLVTSSATVFEDAINIQNIIIMYKSMSTAIYFKSFSSDEIDPDLISGFLSAVQSFGKELKSQKSLNELSYGDKTLLFADGEFIRVTLVLGRPASPFLKRNLAKFVAEFETEFQDDLVGWRGKIDQFQRAGDLVDQVLRTSVILPHSVDFNDELIKQIQRPFGRKLLDITEEMVSDERPFIFLAQILENAIENTEKSTGEIILHLDELLDLKILTPIRLEDLQQQEEMTQSELEELKAQIWNLPDKSEQEKEELLGQLRKLSRSEREVILQSLQQSFQIAEDEGTSPISEYRDISSKKDAKKVLKDLEKKAKRDFKAKNYGKAIEKFEIAENIAFQWKLTDSGNYFANLALEALVTQLKVQLAEAQKTMKRAAKEKDYQTAKTAARNAYDAANRIFKLGFVEYQGIIKKLSGKIPEYKHKLEEQQQQENNIET